MSAWPVTGLTEADIGSRRYDAARQSRLADGWVPRITSADVETRVDLPKLWARCRDLVRNSARAKRIIEIHASNIVGDGIVPRVTTNDDALDRRVAALWRRSVEEIDAAGLTDFYGLQRQIAKGTAEAGEVLARFRPRRPDDGLAVPLQLQLLEAEHLDVSKDSDRPLISQGVEFGDIGNRVAFWLYPEHPGSARPRSLVSARVDAAQVMHVFRVDRPGQNRGVPWLAPVVSTIKTLGELEHATLVQARVAACIGAFITSPLGEAASPLGVTEGNAPTDQGVKIESFEPGMIVRLAPGEDVKMATPAEAGSFDQFALYLGMEIAAGAGVTYDQLSGDLRQANYSSLRAGKIEFRLQNQAHQYHMMIPMFCRPFFRRWWRAAVDAGMLPDVPYNVEWIPPAEPSIDQLKDVEADIAAARAGVLPWSYLVSKWGYDPDVVLAEIKTWQAKLDEAGVVVSTDARRPTNGAMQQSVGAP